MTSPEYVKQLEDALEKMQERFESVYKEVEGCGREFWYDLNAILPFQDGQQAYSLVYQWDKNLPQPAVGLTIKKKNYTGGNSADDIVTVGEVYDILYAKPASCKFDGFSKLMSGETDYVDELRSMLYTTFLKASNIIAQDTRRGAGSIVILSEEVGFQLSKVEQFELSPSDSTRGFRLQKIGTIGRFDIIIDYKNKTNKAIVIYRGKQQNDGCGCILNNSGVRHWYRPDGYENYWQVVDII